MKKKLFKVLLGLSVFTLGFIGCAVLNPNTLQQTDKAYALSYDPLLGGFRTSARFEGTEYLKEREDQMAAKELRAPNYAGIPAVGIITVRINDGFLEGANPKNALYILVDNSGKEIYRANGQNRIPSYDVSSYNGQTSTVWSAFDSFPVEDITAEFPLTLRVVRIEGETVDIKISKSSN
jgi:hypothetical protein